MHVRNVAIVAIVAIGCTKKHPPADEGPRKPRVDLTIVLATDEGSAQAQTPSNAGESPVPNRLATPAGSQPAAVVPKDDDDDAAPAKSGGKGNIIGLVLLVIALAAIAGAYFGGLMK